MNFDTQCIRIDNLANMARGNAQMMEKYLRQFQDLIPARIENLQQILAAKDRKMIRQIIHQMSPQLQFFGIPNVLASIRKLEDDYLTMPFSELEKMVEELVMKLSAAKEEVDRILQENFENK